MHKKIRITLVIFILIILLPTSTSAQRIDVEGIENQSCLPCPDCDDKSSCSPIPPTGNPKILEDNNFLSWEGSFEPVLGAGPSGSWDDRAVIGPEVLYTGTGYLMWYSGVTGTTWQIGHATSYNGLTWIKSPHNPVLTVGAPGSWDDERAWAPAVIYNSSLWQMWYVGYSDATGSQIGYATSADGINWVKYSGNPVFSPGIFDEWESNGVNAPYVMYENGIYHMWYSSHPDGSIGYAASSDGINWERHPDNPLIEPYDSDDENCGLYFFVSPTVVLLDEYHMWYQRWQSCRGGTGGYDIVHSTSTDRVTWSKPERVFGISGIWNAHYPTVISHHSGLLNQMVYTHSGKIYYAEENQLVLRRYLPLAMR